MADRIDKIQTKLAFKENVLDELAKLSGSELNTFLLELNRIRTGKIIPTELLNDYQSNRFVAPATTDIVKLKESEIEWLKTAASKGFRPLHLSPVAPLGASSVFGCVSQNNVVSALRGTEVLSDATNVMAMQIALDFKSISDRRTIQKYCTTHRHVRAQPLTNPKHTPHFSIFCMTSGGYDTGSFEFELSQLDEHIAIVVDILATRFERTSLKLKFYLRKNAESFVQRFNESSGKIWNDMEYKFIDRFDNDYYTTVQFKIFVDLGGTELDIADGGMVNWTQKLLSNNKHRLMISGIGLELVEKISPR